VATQTLADEAFGASMYRLLAADTPDLVFSPASVAAALRMALCGARGETAAELAAVLHLETGHVTGSAGDAPDLAAAGLRELDDLAASTPEDITFRVANTAWAQSGLPLLPEFTARLSASPSSTITDADFAAAPERAREHINETIEKQTAGKIKNLLPASTVSTLTRLVLANAVYLKAPWADPFPVNATKDAPFHAGPGRPVTAPMMTAPMMTAPMMTAPMMTAPMTTVPMMRGRANREYLRGDGYQAVLLPYRASTLAMAIVLPDGPLSDLSGRALSGLLAGTAPHQVTLSLPRFRVETDIDLGPVLVHLGVRAAFSGAADFTGITTAEPLRIGAAVHKAYIDVDEHGTEAAAATALVMRALAARKPPPAAEMVVDRPFLYAIIDTPSGRPLFLGQVTHPGRT
jgi:serpin B